MNKSEARWKTVESTLLSVYLATLSPLLSLSDWLCDLFAYMTPVPSEGH